MSEEIRYFDCFAGIGGFHCGVQRIKSNRYKFSHAAYCEVEKNAQKVYEIYHLREIKQNALVDNAEREGMKQRISEMQQFLSEQTQEITEYDEQLVRRLIEKITVFEEKVTVEFKSGTSVDVRR